MHSLEVCQRGPSLQPVTSNSEPLGIRPNGRSKTLGCHPSHGSRSPLGTRCSAGRCVCHLPFIDLCHDIVQVIGAIHHGNGSQLNVQGGVQCLEGPILSIETSDLHGIVRVLALHLGVQFVLRNALVTEKVTLVTCSAKSSWWYSIGVAIAAFAPARSDEPAPQARSGASTDC